MIHQLKIEQHYLIHLLQEIKNFQIRYNDRDFQVGDEIQFLPLESDNYDVYKLFPAPLPRFTIRYVHSGYGMKDGFVALAVTQK